MRSLPLLRRRSRLRGSGDDVRLCWRLGHDAGAHAPCNAKIFPSAVSMHFCCGVGRGCGSFGRGGWALRGRALRRDDRRRTGDPHNRYWCLVPVSASPARERTITWLQKNHWKLETGVQSMLKGTYHTQTLFSIPNGQAGRCTRVSNGSEIARGLPKAQPASSATRTTE